MMTLPTMAAETATNAAVSAAANAAQTAQTATLIKDIDQAGDRQTAVAAAQTAVNNRVAGAEFQKNASASILQDAKKG